MLKVMDHARSFMPAHMIAAGGLEKGGQLGTSTAEPSKAGSVPFAGHASIIKCRFKAVHATLDISTNRYCCTEVKSKL